MPVPLMPANERYDGNLYRRVTTAHWADASRTGAEVVIVSALYGLLTPSEPIRWYNAWMGQKTGERTRLSRWWKQHALPELLAEYVVRSGAEVVHDFLSGPYSGAGAELDAVKGIKLVRHKYAGLGSGSDFHRGSDVDHLLAAPRSVVEKV